MKESVEVKVGKIETNVDNLQKAFFEFKNDTKNFHTHQTEKLDQIAKDWGNISGSLNGMADIRKALNDLQSTVDHYEPMLKEVAVERTEDRKRVRNFIWKAVAVAAVLILFGSNASKIIGLIL